MRKADQVLEDEELIGLVYEALGRRCPQSRVRGRRGTPERESTDLNRSAAGIKIRRI